ncbi:ligand-binding sensor domain-containing protein [Xanthocytophaga agilis]|uniref:Oxygen sensor histidine kinase NreB n=1 Tax=Xanthocytophaga agilis TaxID=3048010 RepID=A0AAE3RAK4_9BACT|nr:triple tyrosine motif-containing protein [Xanthocytophaga agilis]MDJ1506714.1 triple tyrosine motif-containing protein [Xanthocytophaga agilis]
MIQKLVLFLLLSSSLILSVRSQNQIFRHLEAPAEINNLEIFCTFQDSNGLMWIGTNNGLYSYDGYSFRHYENPVEGDFSITVIQEVDHKLWLGAWRNSGLWMFDKTTGIFTNAKDLPGFASFLANVFSVRNIYLDGNIVWFIATLMQRKSSVLVKYNLLTREFNYYYFRNPAHIDHLEFNTFTKTIEAGREIMWIGTHMNGLYEFDLETRKYTIHLPDSKKTTSLSHYDIRYVYASPSEPALWIGTKEGLNKMDLMTRQITQKYFYKPGSTNSITDDRIWTVLEINRKVWVATENGLSCINLMTNQVSRFRHIAKDPESITGSFIRGLYPCQGLLWISTFGGGINQIDLQSANFQHYPLSSMNDDGLIGSSITALDVGDDQGKSGVWIGTENGLFFLDTKSKSIKKHVGTENDPMAFHSILAKDNALWLETSKGFRKYTIATHNLSTSGFKRETVDSLSNNSWFRSSFATDPTGIWMGSWEHGLTHLETSSGRIKNYTPTLLNNVGGRGSRQATFPCIVTHKGKKYVFFISTVPYISANVQTERNCLVRFEPETNEYTYYTQEPQTPYSLAANYLTSLKSSGDSVLWLGTHKNGLEKFDISTERFTHFRVKEGIKATTIFNLTTDLHGNLWMSTNEGISKLDIHTKHVTDFKGKFLEGNYWMIMVRDNSGYIYYGTNNGVLVFHPDSLKVNPYPPSTTITSLRVFDKEYDPNTLITPGKHITLSYKNNFVSFEFAALNFREPERNEYMYQMVGVDEQWNYAGSRRYVSYANIEPGDYEFRVRSSNNDGIWNSKWTSVFISITPPWWATLWFRALMAIVVLFSVWGFYRLRIDTLKQRQVQLEMQVRTRTSEIIYQKEEIAVQQNELARMNEYLKVLSDTLEDRVHLRTSELVRANEELRRKNEEIQQALIQGQTLERKRVAAELHDNLGGLLSALKFSLETLDLQNLSEGEKNVYENVLTMVANACVEVRNISHNMLPEVLEKEGLEVALKRFIYSINATKKIDFELDLFGLEERLEKDIEFSIYPICVELVNNIFKHAEATTASLQIIYSENELSIVVEDNGKGIKNKDGADGMGLKNLKSRIEAMLGVYYIDSVPERGTTISIEIPLEKRKNKKLNVS